MVFEDYSDLAYNVLDWAVRAKGGVLKREVSELPFYSISMLALKNARSLTLPLILLFAGKQFTGLTSVDAQLFIVSSDTHPSKPIGLAGGITALRLASKASMLSFTSCK